MLKASKWTCRLPKSSFKTFFLEARQLEYDPQYYTSFFIRPCTLPYRKVLSFLKKKTATGPLYLYECCTSFILLDCFGNKLQDEKLTMPEFILEYTVQALSSKIKIDFIAPLDNDYNIIDVTDLHTGKKYKV